MDTFEAIHQRLAAVKGEMTPDEVLDFVLNSDSKEWFEPGALTVLAHFRDSHRWGQIKTIAKERGIFPLDIEKAVDTWTKRNGHHATPDDAITRPWRAFLLTKKNGDPTTNITNIGLILANHEHWRGRFWWDAVRSTPMLDDAPLDDQRIVQIAQWLGMEEHLALSNTRPLEQCIVAECHKQPRDLLQHWLHALPTWDGVERLNYWLHDVAEITNDAYGMAVSRILPLSMVARVMTPGCLYRYVVILEGPEDTGKSTLVRTLAGQGWYVELSMGLESKEAHMMLQGAWLAELAELDSLSRTEETRLKAFITLTEDTWIPKYSNFRISTPRRTIFVGTTNDESYLKGQTGNTRFLPIKTGLVDTAGLVSIRDQLFAEAFHVYQQAPYEWWRLPPEALEQAKVQRENRRIINVYEDCLSEFLEGRTQTSWQEIARAMLNIDPAAWKDKSLQMQIAQALKTLGWVSQVVWKDGRTRRIWEPKTPGT